MAKKKTAKRASFPEQIYVVRETSSGDETFLSADESFDGIDDGADVAIYTLLKVRRKRVTHELKD